VMPPCQSNLHHHIMRANYVAYIFWHADQLLVELESPDEHGWDGDGNVVWSDICYPEEIDVLLAGTKSENSSSYDNDYEDDLDVEIEDTSGFWKGKCKICDQNVPVRNAMHNMTPI
jgi:hypothetical protein